MNMPIVAHCHPLRKRSQKILQESAWGKIDGRTYTGTGSDFTLDCCPHRFNDDLLFDSLYFHSKSSSNKRIHNPYHFLLFHLKLFNYLLRFFVFQPCYVDMGICLFGI